MKAIVYLMRYGEEMMAEDGKAKQMSCTSSGVLHVDIKVATSTARLAFANTLTHLFI